MLGLQDEPVSVHGDHQDGEGGEEDAGGLEAPYKLADEFLKSFQFRAETCGNILLKPEHVENVHIIE